MKPSLSRDLVDALFQLEHLLRRTGYGGDDIRHITDLLGMRPEDAMKELTDPSWWHFHLDLCLYPVDRWHVSDDWDRDNRVYRRLLLQIRLNLRKRGLLRDRPGIAESVLWVLLPELADSTVRFLRENSFVRPKDPDFARPLIEMEQLLRRSGYIDRARELRGIIRLLESDPAGAMLVLSGHRLWGRGGFFDLTLQRDKQHPSVEPERDNRAYSRMMLQLLRNVETEGLAVPDRDVVEEHLRQCARV